jgi:hypothetical protein
MPGKEATTALGKLMCQNGKNGDGHLGVFCCHNLIHIFSQLVTVTLICQPYTKRVTKLTHISLQVKNDLFQIPFLCLSWCLRFEFVKLPLQRFICDLRTLMC